MAEMNRTKGVVIDVRESKEYADNCIAGSINLPSSSFNLDQYEPYRSHMIGLVCQTGNRANLIAKKLNEQGFAHVFVMEKQMADLSSESVHHSKKGWSVDRQFRMLLGLLLALFLLGYSLDLLGFFVIPIILCTGLIFTALIDRCYLRMGIAMLPWNRDRRA